MIVNASRLEQARGALGMREFTRRSYLALFPTMSTATASRDLAAAVATGELVRRGDKATATYRFTSRRPSRG